MIAPWVRLAAPNAIVSYGMRKRQKGERVFFGNEEEHYGMKPWTVRGDVAVDPTNGSWEFINNIYWYSVALPPAPEQPTE